MSYSLVKINILYNSICVLKNGIQIILKQEQEFFRICQIDLNFRSPDRSKMGPVVHTSLHLELSLNPSWCTDSVHHEAYVLQVVKGGCQIYNQSVHRLLGGQ